VHNSAGVEALDTFLARLHGKTGVETVLVMAGSCRLNCSGLLARCGSFLKNICDLGRR
jgi:hypothetical protein